MDLFLLILLPFAIGLVISWLAAKRFDEIAQMKGQPPKKYFWWCFWVGMIGWAMVIALPDRAGINQKIADSSDDLPEL